MSWLNKISFLPLSNRRPQRDLTIRVSQIRAFERMPEHQQRDMHQLSLRKLLVHAYATTPYYKKRFDDAGFDPSQARTDRPLPLPPLTRNELRSEGHNQLSNAFLPSDLRLYTTGTSNAPVKFQCDLNGLKNKTALNHQLNSWAGFQMGDPVMALWGAHTGLTMEPDWRLRLDKKSSLHRIPSSNGIINEEILERFRIRYEKTRPRVLFGYSTVLLAFAFYLKAHGLRHRPKAVIATAEALSPENRKIVETAFGCSIYLQNSSRDIGMVAAECSKHEGLHYHPWGSYVTFDPIGDTPQGPAYRLFITDLLNYGQPLVHYDAGDCVILDNQRCSCGSWFPLVRSFLDSAASSYAFADGRLQPGHRLSFAVKDDFRALLNVEFIQKSRNHLHIRYRVRKHETAVDGEFDSVRETIDAMMGEHMQWTMEKLADIPSERSGKLSVCLLEVNTPNDRNAKQLLGYHQPF